MTIDKAINIVELYLLRCEMGFDATPDLNQLAAIEFITKCFKNDIRQVETIVTNKRICPICNSEFNYKHPKQLYCSNACKQKQFRQSLKVQ